ncbi:ChbG/HpnK family deacetylase [Candidatus Villigracilis affinis]|uniref:carbohydrate deacetylase n=1 Tax=Candidatus Villigracilis affinis TaxID=3140682 RepID=UPI002A1B972E|nr:ChbG/HpnK family deacetylase [Anaerolineales bacterium]
MKRLIINSDDYGRTPEVSRGIRAAHLLGVVTSTTCMMNIPTTAADIKIGLWETPQLGLGVHLVLTADKPIGPYESVKSITDENGNFLKLAALIQRINDIDVNEVKAEWRRQIEAFIQAANKKPTHLDSHHHSSYFSPSLFRAMLELAQEYDCAIRLPVVNDSDDMAGLPPELIGPIREYAPKLFAEFNPRRPKAFFASFYDDLATHDELQRIISEVGDGTYEIMTHPGYVDDELLKASSYARQRETELKILTDPSIKQAIRSNEIELVTFASL